jgi:hypothetical protein
MLCLTIKVAYVGTPFWVSACSDAQKRVPTVCGVHYETQHLNRGITLRG